MSSKTYPVPASWKKRAFVDEAGYKAMYAESVKSPGQVLGEACQAAGLVQGADKNQEHLLCL